MASQRGGGPLEADLGGGGRRAQQPGDLGPGQLLDGPQVQDVPVGIGQGCEEPGEDRLGVGPGQPAVQGRCCRWGRAGRPFRTLPVHGDHQVQEVGSLGRGPLRGPGLPVGRFHQRGCLVGVGREELREAEQRVQVLEGISGAGGPGLGRRQAEGDEHERRGTGPVRPGAGGSQRYRSSRKTTLIGSPFRMLSRSAAFPAWTAISSSPLLPISSSGSPGATSP